MGLASFRDFITIHFIHHTVRKYFFVVLVDGHFLALLDHAHPVLLCVLVDDIQSRLEQRLLEVEQGGRVLLLDGRDVDVLLLRVLVVDRGIPEAAVRV